MGELLDLSLSFPTVVFTVPLLFFLSWFVLSLVLSGLDFGDSDGGLDLDGDGDIDFFDNVGHAFHLGSLGLSLALLLLSFGGWAMSLLFTGLTRSLEVESTISATIGVVVGFAAGFGFLRAVGGPLGRAMTTEPAPERESALGCMCKVRTVDVSPTFGDAEIVSGPMRNSIVRVRAKAGEFRRGDIALLVELDRDTDAYWIAELDEALRPER